MPIFLMDLKSTEEAIVVLLSFLAVPVNAC
jgi:hypothetical protein